jgi:16S rRNA (cytosine967-C5)-methyltransferase
LRTNAADYRQQLIDSGIALEAALPDDGADAVLLTQPQPADSLPGFAQGLVSIQDLGAQQAASLLDVQPGMRVLDACAAPGGKAAHLLELAAIELTAVETDQARCVALERTLDPARFPADRTINIVRADAAETAAMWAKRPFDAILLDAPCSGSGVAGRHPDAKWLRRDEDIYALARTQKRLLRALWPLLKPGGRLLYGTCSVFALENQQQIAHFLQEMPDAQLKTQQYFLPDARHDGFFYALLTKVAP